MSSEVASEQQKAAAKEPETASERQEAAETKETKSKREIFETKLELFRRLKNGEDYSDLNIHKKTLADWLREYNAYQKIFANNNNPSKLFYMLSFVAGLSVSFVAVFFATQNIVFTIINSLMFLAISIVIVNYALPKIQSAIGYSIHNAINQIVKDYMRQFEGFSGGGIEGGLGYAIYNMLPRQWKRKLNPDLLNLVLDYFMKGGSTKQETKEETQEQAKEIMSEIEKEAKKRGIPILFK